LSEFKTFVEWARSTQIQQQLSDNSRTTDKPNAQVSNKK